MPIPAPTPVDALRHYSRAVVLTAGGGAVSRQLRQTIEAAGTRCEILGHPLLALAELIHLSRASREEEPARLTLVVADREIDDLAALFTAVRTHLSQVAIWVFEGELAIEIQRAQLEARPAQLEARPAQLEARPAQVEARPAQVEARPAQIETRPAPVLRIAPAATEAERPISADPSNESSAEDPPGPSGNTVTPEELEMLLDLFDGNRADHGSSDSGPAGNGRSRGGPMR